MSRVSGAGMGWGEGERARRLRLRCGCGERAEWDRWDERTSDEDESTSIDRKEERSMFMYIEC